MKEAFFKNSRQQLKKQSWWETLLPTTWVMQKLHTILYWSDKWRLIIQREPICMGLHFLIMDGPNRRSGSRVNNTHHHPNFNLCRRAGKTNASSWLFLVIFTQYKRAEEEWFTCLSVVFCYIIESYNIGLCKRWWPHWVWASPHLSQHLDW